MLIKEVRKRLIPALDPIIQDHIYRALALDELRQQIHTVPNVRRMLRVRIVAKLWEIVMLVGDFLPEHVEAVQEVEDLGLGEVGVWPEAEFIRHPDGKGGILAQFADLLGWYKDWEDVGADAVPLRVRFITLGDAQDGRWGAIVQ